MCNALSVICKYLHTFPKSHQGRFATFSLMKSRYFFYSTALVIAGGCARQPVSPTQLSANAVGANAAKTGAFKNASSDLPSRTFAQWVSEVQVRMGAYDKTRAHRKIRSPRTFAGMDATQAALHPASQLARTLDGDVTLRSYVAGEAPRVAVQVAMAGFAPAFDISGLNFQSGSTSTRATGFSGVGVMDAALQRWLDGGGTRGTMIYANGLPLLQTQARNRQNGALNAFFAGTSQAQAQVRDDVKSSLEAALRDDVALARRMDPGDIEPYLPSGEQGLILANLRLDLLTTLRTTPAQKQSADAERIDRDTDIRAKLREQELARRRLIDQLREELPAKIEARRRAELQTTLAALETRDTALRDALNDDQRALIAQDFTSNDARLGIVLPSRAPRYANDGAAQLEQNNPKSSRWVRTPGNDSDRTVRGLRASLASDLSTGAQSFSSQNIAVSNAGNVDSGVSAQRGAQNVVLQTLAQHDAAQWKRIAARRERAWRVSSQP